jgi:cytoskeletal protein CcmA (bactofilin family)
MLRDEISIGINGVCAARVLPVPIFTELRDAGTCLCGELTLGMPLNELPVPLYGVGGFRGAPILLFTAAPCHQEQQTDSYRTTSCPDCDHRQHLLLAATGYSTGPQRVQAPMARTRLLTGEMMSDMPKRRLIDQLGSSPTFVAEGCHLTGDVETGGPLVVCGAIRGDGRVGGALSMAAKSQWEGEIHALAAVIAGRISGKLVVENKLEVGSTAVIHADIIARSIAIAKGAVIDGEVTVTSGQPVVRFEEKRGPA